MATQTIAPSTPLLRLDAATGHLRSREYTLVVEEGPDAGARALVSEGFQVGSDASSGLVLKDPAVSRHHVELSPRPDGVRVRDLGSKNGTFVAGLRVQDGVLSSGGTLSIGKSMLRVAVLEEDLGVPRARAAFEGLVGDSEVMRRLFGLLAAIAPTDASVLLLGETGTGKERVASAIHAASSRKRGPFRIVDCGALTATLVDSELFGHVRGAFTGAVADRVGALEAADGGTLFLDEVGELPLELQPRLLRFLESSTLKRVGGDRTRRVDVRIIAATHRELGAAVARGHFRQDLYFRLAVAELRLPALRERPEDVLPLARHFAAARAATLPPLTPELAARLAAHAWPGNLRELRNVVDRLLAGAVDPLQFQGEDPGPSSESFKEAKDRMVERFTREYIRTLWEQHRGNVSAVARTAGIHRNHVTKLLARMRLK